MISSRGGSKNRTRQDLKKTLLLSKKILLLLPLRIGLKFNGIIFLSSSFYRKVNFFFKEMTTKKKVFLFDDICFCNGSM